MNRHTLYLLVLFGAVGTMVFLAGLTLAGDPIPAGPYGQVRRAPRIDPDYVGVVIPPNIAPLNFRVDERGERYAAALHSTHGKEIRVGSRDGGIVIPPKAWRALLDANRGETLHCDVYVRRTDGRWDRFETIENTIAAEEIDRYLVYRLLNAGYRIYVTMGIYQRDIESYRETVVLHNESFGGCVNCHTFRNNRADTMTIQMRSGPFSPGSGMLLIRDGEVSKVNTRTDVAPAPPVYLSWHPSGRAAAFSINKVTQFFHTVRTEVREVVDLSSDLAVYVLDPESVTSTASVSRQDRLETYPVWAPDGRHLYFCSAPVLWSDPARLPPERYDEVRYDLMRISYDVQTGTWGTVETVLSAEDTGLSITLPRISPDGRFLLFCMAEYGCFPVHLASADLYMMDLRTGEYRRLDVNSDLTDSWHSWSSNGRWFVFSSKRRDGLLARPYFAYVDEDGNVHRPVLLPQKAPAFYDSFLRTYNVPELIREPVPVAAEEIERVILSSPWPEGGLPVTSATPSSNSQADSAPGDMPPRVAPLEPRGR